MDAITGEIAAHVLTEGTADDAQQVPDLLRTVEGTIASVTADGAYDGEPTYAAVRARQADPPPDVVIPPRACAVPSTSDPTRHTARDCHIQLMAEKGRMEWQRRMRAPAPLQNASQRSATLTGGAARQPWTARSVRRFYSATARPFVTAVDTVTQPTSACACKSAK